MCDLVPDRTWMGDESLEPPIKRCLLETLERIVLHSQGAKGYYRQVDIPICVRRHSALMSHMRNLPGMNPYRVLPHGMQEHLLVLECLPYNFPLLKFMEITNDNSGDM